MPDSAEPKYVDFHCHLDLYPDLVSAIAECERNQIYTLTVTTTPKAWPRNFELTGRSKYVRVALGLHPQLVAERSSEIALWEKYFPQAKYIGEVGLDEGPQHFKSIDLQRDVFQKILKHCALHGEKILTVHSVRSSKQVLDMVEANLPPHRGKVVLHWFTGSKSEARRAIDMGCYFSVNNEMIRNDRHREMIESLPIDRILTESDGPFIKIGERSIRPTDIVESVKSLAAICKMSPQQMTSTIQNNLKRLVSDVFSD